MNGATVTLRRGSLARYGEVECRPGGEERLGRYAALWLAICLAGGLALSTRDVPHTGTQSDTAAQRVTIAMNEVTLPRPVATPEPEPVAAAPVLEPETVLAQPIDRPSAAVPVTPDRPPVPAATDDPEPAPAAPARRVYGVRRVYARGLGGGSGAGGLVVKTGNTLDGLPDTLTATAADLQGRLAPLSSVESAPEPVHRERPAYSAALTAARAEGVVAAYLLIDVDGRVRDVKIVEDIGFDSAVVAEAAFRKFTFRPARRDGEPVAVWILHRIRFEFQD